MAGLSKKQIAEVNRKIHEETERDFKEFKSALALGQCCICKESINSFDTRRPCMHWLLMPPGFKKKHFPLVFANFGPDRIEAYLRWFANAHEIFRGINDIGDENGERKSVMDVTISHNNLEWSFSASWGCLEGKHGSQPPHYHFQMRVNNLPFINYSQFHIPLNDYDKWMIGIKKGENEQIKHIETYGMGMRGALEEVAPDVLLKSMRTASEPDRAAFNVQTMVTAKDGKMISGDVLADLFKRSKELGVPFAQLAQDMDGVDVETWISEGEGVAPSAPRTPHNRGKSKKK